VGNTLPLSSGSLRRKAISLRAALVRSMKRSSGRAVVRADHSDEHIGRFGRIEGDGGICRLGGLCRGGGKNPVSAVTGGKGRAPWKVGGIDIGFTSIPFTGGGGGTRCLGVEPGDCMISRKIFRVVGGHEWTG
jgi:hypothetical protein